MNHPRIVHLCNVKEIAPSKRLNYKVLIYLFYLFASWSHNIETIIIEAIHGMLAEVGGNPDLSEENDNAKTLVVISS